MMHARWIAALLACCLLLVAPLAHGAPPDPGWLAGFWDDGDHDDIVWLIVSTAGAFGIVHATAPRPTAAAARVEPASASRSQASWSCAPTRAPPR